MNNENDKIRSVDFLSDLEINHDASNLNDLEEKISIQEEQLLSEIVDLQNGMESHPSLMHDILEAVKKGASDYLDSMTDTGDTFNGMKDPSEVSRLDGVEIDKKNKPATIEENKGWQTRTMREAKSNPFDKNTSNHTTGMSSEGAKKFERYKEAYSQRTKSITAVSAEGNTIKTSDSGQNYESLSGLRGYRVGPVVPMPSVEEMKVKYKAASDEGIACSPSGFIRKENFAAFDKKLMEEFGFKTRSEAEKWRKDNHLTIHEGPDGMFLVPTDVHDAVAHQGYCSKLAAVLKGEEGAEEALKSFKSEEAKQYIKHEIKDRGTRAVKGIALSAVKDVLKHTIIIVCKETYAEFQKEDVQSFINHIKSILRRCWESVKQKIKNILSNIWSNIKGSLISEFLTALNDFLFGTFKKIFKLVRQMWGSIKNAFKVICSKGSSWEDKIFEATKILSAGVVGIMGFSLNELIEKGLSSIGVPFSSFIAECLSGLFAGIMSALVLMIFDRAKKNYNTPSPYVQLALANSKLLYLESAKIDIASIKTFIQMKDTVNLFGQYLEYACAAQKEHDQIEESERMIYGDIDNKMTSIDDIQQKTKMKLSNLKLMIKK